MSIFKINKLILKAINSQDREIFCEVMESFIKNNVIGIFKKKYYIWNIIRPRDIYKLTAYWIEKYIDDPDTEIASKRIEIMHELLLTTKSIKIRKSFVWGLLKHVNLLTIYTIQYASEDKIKNIVSKIGNKDYNVYSDKTLLPLLIAVREQLQTYIEDTEFLNKMLEF